MVEQNTICDDGVTLSWKNLSIFVTYKEKSFFKRTKVISKQIINKVSGNISPGKLIAILGPSGAGKTTFLKALAYRHQGGVTITGEILVNGQELQGSMYKISGFMHQEDLFVSSLTVREHLNLMALLKMDRRISYNRKLNYANHLIRKLGLLSCIDNRIGGIGIDSCKMNISGGERKRLSFATECLINPPILFCDEPTTGLDSYSAQRIISIMRDMTVDDRKTIICTIHQPSPEILEMFDSVILLADGVIVYSGHANDAINFFQKNGHVMKEHWSPGEYLIDVLAPKPGFEIETHNTINKLLNEYHENIENIEIKSEIKPINLNHESEFAIVKLLFLCYRSLLDIIRNPNIQALKIFQKIILAVMSGLCYVGTIRNSQAGVQAVQGALFIIVTENTFSPMYAVLNIFPSHFPVITREYKNGVYSPTIFYLSQIITTFPGLVLEASIFTIIFYFLAGLRSTIYALMIVMLFSVMCINVSTACGYLFSTAFQSPSFAMAYLIPFDYAMMITSGLFVKLSSLPTFTSWIQYLSWLMYSYEGMSIVQWQNTNNITCSEDQPYLPCAHTGEEVLETYSFSSENLYRNIYAMISLYVTFHVSAYLCFLYRIKNR